MGVHSDTATALVNAHSKQIKATHIEAGRNETGLTARKPGIGSAMPSEEIAMTQRDQARKISLARLTLMAGISISMLGGSALVPATGDAVAQSHFNQRQIIQKLRLPRGHKVRRGAPQSEGPVVRRRAPQSNGPVVVKRRAPPSNGGPVVVKRRAPQPDGPIVVKRRAPQPGGNNVPVIRAPQPEGGVAQFRAPPPTSKSRAALFWMKKRSISATLNWVQNGLSYSTTAKN